MRAEESVRDILWPVVGIFTTIVLSIMWFASNYANNAQDARNQRKTEAELGKTLPGDFAIKGMHECKSTHGLFDPERSDIECISTVVTGARNLKGQQFADDAAKVLSTWTEKKDQNWK